MKPRIVALLVLALGGCAGAQIPANPTVMTPEQLKEWVKDKNANVTCGYTNNPYGKFSATMVVLDKGIIPNGTVIVDETCKITIMNGKQSPLP